MTGKSVHFRIDDDEYFFLVSEAKKLKITANALAKIRHREAMAGFDRKHEALLELMRSVLVALEKGNILAASAVISAALPVGIDATQDDAVAQQVREHVEEAIRLGRNMSSTYDKGRFDE
ncbi:hypothetical protein DBB29_24860 [Pandoraea cepalis]|uniref:Rha family transcriptional regulator n=1 Tax=Pandoraea cepalis TaxID=2508294 RepID=A0AAW7MGP4_9BURK|nr:hypothetical protein [Pandoraea cepalis]MDN4571893.1 hypothetical protein [Pandoraea cepalis]MDN4581347.1 hypothetical protein [Pandoraea cepalis]